MADPHFVRGRPRRALRAGLVPLLASVAGGPPRRNRYGNGSPPGDSLRDQGSDRSAAAAFSQQARSLRHPVDPPGSRTRATLPVVWLAALPPGSALHPHRLVTVAAQGRKHLSLNGALKLSLVETPFPLQPWCASGSRRSRVVATISIMPLCASARAVRASSSADGG